MPGQTWYGDKLKEAIRTGQVPQEKVDDSVMRILIPMFRQGLFDKQNTGSLDKNVSTAEH